MAASRRQILQDLQAVADAGQENNLAEDIRVLFDSAVSEGLIEPRKGQGVSGFIKEAISPRFQEDFPEVESALRMPTNPAEAQSYINQLSDNPLASSGEGLFGKYVGAQVSQDRYGRPTVQTRAGEQRYLNRGGFSAGDIPRAVRGALEITEEVAPYLAGAGVPTLVKGALTQGGIGLLAEAGDVAERAIRGEDLRVDRLLTTPSIAMLGDVFGRGIFGLGQKIYLKATSGRAVNELVDETTGQLKPVAIRETQAAPGQVDDSALATVMDTAESGGFTPQQMVKYEAGMEELIAGNKLTNQQIERYNTFRRLNMQPTRAQVTRDPEDFASQQEVIKSSSGSRVSSQLDQQQLVMRQTLENARESTGGIIDAEVAPIQQAVINKALILDEKISALYRKAEESLSGARKVNISEYVNKLDSSQPKDKRSVGTVTALRGQLESDFGFTLPKGRISPDTEFLVTPKEAEMIRQYSNSLFEGANPTAKGIIYEAKEAIDNDVARTLGRDAFQEARSAYSEFRRGLDPEQLSKFSRNQKSLIRDLLEERVPSEEVFNRVVARKGYTANDLRALKDYIVGSGDSVSAEGARAWASLRAETYQYILDKSARGNLNQLDIPNMTRAAFNRVINDSIGMNKLKVLFSEEEIKVLMDLAKVTKYIEPVGSSGGGYGPSAMAVFKAAEMAPIPGVSQASQVGQSLLTARRGAKQAAEATSPLEAIAQGTRRVNPDIIRSTGGAVGAGAAQLFNKEQR